MKTKFIQYEEEIEFYRLIRLIFVFKLLMKYKIKTTQIWLLFSGSS
jgi:hypothetical protein